MVEIYDCVRERCSEGDESVSFRKSAAQKRKNTLLDDDDGGEVDVNAEWTVNENFAKRFTHNKQREDLHRLQELKKRGMAGSDSDDSESEDEDEDGKLPAKTDVQIFETLAMIKKKDPVIYKPEAKFYDDEEDEEEDGEAVETKKKKPVYLKDVQARHLLDGDDDEEEDMPKKKVPKVKTYADEQEELKHSFLRSVAEAEDSDGALVLHFFFLHSYSHNYPHDNPVKVSGYSDIRVGPF